MSAPDHFICPITGEIMTDPVNACIAGHIFERSAITQWVDGGHATCPTCRGPLGSHRPERHLKQAIADWNAAHPSGAVAGLSTPPFRDGDVKVQAALSTFCGQNYLHIAVETNPANVKQGSIYIIGLDNSGSMAELTDDTAKEVFYTRMDLSKHTINSIAALLGPEDSIALVSFSTEAKIVMEPTSMDDVGRSTLKALLKTVNPEASTNIDAAIRTMMGIANRPEMAGRNIVGALLTDGAETVIPSPSGTVKALSRVAMKNPWVLSTFGLGYELNSILLAQLSEMGGGTFGFIPDLTMIATVFINWVANTMMVGNRGINIDYSVLGKPFYPTSFSTGPILIGQRQEFLIPVPMGAQVSVRSRAGGDATDVAVEWTPPGSTDFQIARHEYISAMEKTAAIAETRWDADLALVPLTEFKNKFAVSDDPRIKALLLDVSSMDPTEGQIGMATKFWARWGGHYLRSYRRSQQVQRRLNFKDRGSLIYGGDETTPFGKLVTAGEEMFMSLEPPVPTGFSRSVAPPAAYDPTTASAYLRNMTQGGQSGGCFYGGNLVRMYDDSFTQIQYLKPGDRVWVPGGNAKVVALVTIGHGDTRSLMMSKVGECFLTPYHPFIHIDEVGQVGWVVGADTVGQDVCRDLNVLYNLVLDSGHIINIGGIMACTLAHGLTGPIIGHPFFGTDLVLECLKKCPGWAFGLPKYDNLQVRRENGVIMEWYDEPLV
jgi:Mg-chelatase subunit ChlD